MYLKLDFSIGFFFYSITLQGSWCFPHFHSLFFSIQHFFLIHQNVVLPEILKACCYYKAVKKQKANSVIYCTLILLRLAFLSVFKWLFFSWAWFYSLWKLPYKVFMPTCFEERIWTFMISVNKLMKIQIFNPGRIMSDCLETNLWWWWFSYHCFLSLAVSLTPVLQTSEELACFILFLPIHF